MTMFENRRIRFLPNSKLVIWENGALMFHCHMGFSEDHLGGGGFVGYRATLLPYGGMRTGGLVRIQKESDPLDIRYFHVKEVVGDPELINNGCLIRQINPNRDEELTRRRREYDRNKFPY